MKELPKTIKQLRTDLEALNKKEGARLNDIYEKIKSLDDSANAFDDLWIGGWGQEDYNHYLNYYNSEQAIECNYEYFVEVIEKKNKVNLDKIGKEIIELLKPYKKFQTHLLAELSPINDNEKFKNEMEILKSIEKFKWGIEPNSFAKMRMPNQIPVYDMSQLAKGIRTPPHIAVMAYLASITTKSFSVRNFDELVVRILRQIEIKLNTGPEIDENGYGQNFLTDLFENFHSFYNQLKNRHAKRLSIEIIDEYDVQDLIHALLKLRFKDVREEEYTPSYAGGSSRVDFLLKSENIVIEIKKTRDRLADREVGEQLILDVAYYRNHPNCKALKCFVYDPENRIKNPRGLENDIRKLSDDDMSVELFIRP